MSFVVSEFCDLLQSHANRDKVVSLASCVLKLWGATSKKDDLMTASARLVGARATMRLFDDAAAFNALINYGLGTKDGPLWGTVGVASCTLTSACLQCEKLVWLIDSGLLKVSKEAEFWCRASHKLFWSLCSTVGLIRSIRALHLAAEELKSPRRRKCAPARFTDASLTTTKLLLDVVHSVSWLPPGWLWGGKLTVSQVSGVATASAVLALITHYHGKKLK